MKRTSLQVIVAWVMFAGLASADEFKVLNRTHIDRWIVEVIQTERDGLSCQARRCNVRSCDSPDSIASILLWGSQNRRAITPMVGAYFSLENVKRASVVVGDNSFQFEQAPNSVGKRYIPVNESDDARLAKVLAASSKETFRFVTERGEARFKLKGIDRVFAFFEDHCQIPKP